MDSTDYEFAESLLDLWNFKEILEINGLDYCDVLAILISLGYVEKFDPPQYGYED